jgi:3-deoxy-D-manno-octulosonate 8-phosphate phosphatase KdsC-like HAD superfamily phosphatase
MKTFKQFLIEKLSKKILYLYDFDGTLIDSKGFNQNYLVDPKPIMKNINKVKKLLKQDKEVYVLTARSKKSVVEKELKKHGIENIKIITLGDSSKTAKAKYIKKHFAKKYDTVYLYDDNQGYIDAVKKEFKDTDYNVKAIKV